MLFKKYSAGFHFWDQEGVKNKIGLDFFHVVFYCGQGRHYLSRGGVGDTCQKHLLGLLVVELLSSAETKFSCPHSGQACSKNHVFSSSKNPISNRLLR